MLVRARTSPRPILTRLLAPVGAALAFAAQALAQGPDVAKLAPAQSFLVVGVQDFTQFHAAFDKSELGKLWGEPAVQAWVEKTLEKESARFTDLLKGMNIDRKDLKP